VADENTGAYPIFSSVSTTNENTYLFHRPAQPTKILLLFSSAIEADENICKPTKMRSFSSILFRRPIFVGRPTNIYIFDGFLAIFGDFWPTKISYFVVVGRTLGLLSD
jgi:hypothetical protein